MHWFQYPWLIAFLSAYYVWFSLGAWCIVLARALFWRMRRRELLLLSVFVGCVILEIVQLTCAGGKPFSHRETLSLTRYFGVLGPLLWLWTAWGLRMVWGKSGGTCLWLRRFFVVAYLFYVLIQCNIRFFMALHEAGPAMEAWKAGARAAMKIRADWQGPTRRPCMRYSRDEYLTANLPAVFDTWCAGAWWVRGQSEGANLRHYAYRPDYILLNEREGYRRKLKKGKSESFEVISRMKGSGCEWVLVKRNRQKPKEDGRKK